MSRGTFFYLFLLVSFLGSTFWALPAGADPQSGPVKVVATIGMIADVAQNIGGPRVAAQALMGEGVDPHLYKASPGDMRLLADADIILFSGLHLEGKMADIFVKMARKKPTFAVTETIDEKFLREPPEFAGQYDPHVWFDVSLWTTAAKRIGEIFAENDVPNAAEYRQRTGAYIAKLNALHEWCKTELAKLPQGQRVLVTAHDAFGYFGRAYGFEVFGIQGISTESEASLRDMNHLIDLIVSRKIPAVFVESSVPRKTVEALVEGCRSRGHELKIGGELFSDSMGKPGTPDGTYIGMVEHNVRTIVGALSGGK